MSSYDVKILWVIAIVAVAYFGSGRLMLALTSDPNVALLWPPAGIALGVMLIKDWRIWPGVMIGSLFANMLQGTGLATAFGISCGATLAAVLGWYALTQWTSFDCKGYGAKDAFLFLSIGGIVSPVISAAVGNGCLVLSGILDWSGLAGSFLSWWFGDAMGVITVGSMIVIFYAISNEGVIHRVDG